MKVVTDKNDSNDVFHINKNIEKIFLKIQLYLIVSCLNIYDGKVNYAWSMHL